MTQSMNIPPALKKGDLIALVAPAGVMKNPEKVARFENYLKEKGFRVFIHPQVYQSFGSFAGTDDERIKALQDVMDNEEVSAIWAVRGGYGSIRIIDQLNWERFKKQPKWLVGFSDITVFHAFLFSNKIASIHGPMPVQWDENFSTAILDSTLDLMMLKKIKYQTMRDSMNLHEKDVKGILTGGNAATLASLAGSHFLPDQPHVLFLEDVDEHLYALDRIFRALDKAGIFQKTEALILGSFTEIKQDFPPFPFSIKQIIREAVKKYGFPVFFGFSAGHISRNFPLVFGKYVQIKVHEKNWELIIQDK